MPGPSPPATSSTSATRLARAGEAASRAVSLRPSDPNVRRGLYAGITIVVILSVGLLAWSSLSDLPDIEGELRPAWLAVALASFLALVLLNAIIWRRLLDALDGHLSPRRATAIWCVSAVARYVPTSLLMPVVRSAMAERQGVPKRVTLVSIVYELAFTLTGALVVGAYFVIDLEALGGEAARFLALTLPVLALVFLQPAIFHRAVDFALSTFGRSELPIALDTPAVLKFAALYTVPSLLGGLAACAVAQAIYPIEGSDVITVIGAFSVGTLASLLGFLLPGGLVARETAFVIALAPVMPASPAVAVAILVRIVQLVAELLLAVLGPVIARPRASVAQTGRTTA